MGSGASQNLEEAQKVVRDLESVIAATSMLMGLNPRHIRFPDMYSIFDFEIRDDEDADGFANDILSEMKRELQFALKDEANMSKQADSDSDDDCDTVDKEKLKRQDKNNNEGSKDGGGEDEGDDGLFVFKGTVSPSAEVKNKNKHKVIIEPAFVVAVPDAGLVKF